MNITTPFLWAQLVVLSLMLVASFSSLVDAVRLYNAWQLDKRNGAVEISVRGGVVDEALRVILSVGLVFAASALLLNGLPFPWDSGGIVIMFCEVIAVASSMHATVRRFRLRAAIAEEKRKEAEKQAEAERLAREMKRRSTDRP